MVKEAKKIFLFTRGYQPGHRTGKLNSRKCHRIISSGDTRVFMKKSDNTKLGDIAICLLVDESGSMGGVCERYAREASIVLHEVFRQLDIKHLICGFTADDFGSGRSTDHKIYRYWNDRNVGGNLTKISSYACNRDGDSIRLATGYLSKVTAKKKLLIIISDGAPSAFGYCGDTAMKDTHESHIEAEREGVKVINVGIGPTFVLPDFYLNKVKVDDVADLPKRLMKVIKQEIMK